MIKDLINVKINNKTYVPIDDLIEDLENHLNNEISDVEEEDKHGFELGTHETIVHLSHYL